MCSTTQGLWRVLGKSKHMLYTDTAKMQCFSRSICCEVGTRHTRVVGSWGNMARPFNSRIGMLYYVYIYIVKDLGNRKTKPHLDFALPLCTSKPRCFLRASFTSQSYASVDFLHLSTSFVSKNCFSLSLFLHLFTSKTLCAPFSLVLLLT